MLIFRSLHRLRWLLVAGFLALVCQPASAQLTVEALLRSTVPDADAADYPEVANAIQSFYNQDLNGARSSLEAARQKSPELAVADVMLAQLYFATQQVAAGRVALENAVKEDPSDPLPYLIFGDLALQQRQVTNARLIYEEGRRRAATFEGSPTRKNTLTAQAANGLASVAEMREDWEIANQHLITWIELDSENTTSRIRQGRVLFKLGQVKESYAQFREASRIDSQSTRPEILMARLFEENEESGKAKALIGKAVERDGESLKTRLAAAQWYVNAGLYKEAKENAEAARNINSNSIQALFLLGMIERFEMNHAAAEDAFMAAHLVDPSNAEVINQLALSLIEQTDDPRKQQKALAWGQLAARYHSDLKQIAARESMITVAWIMHRLGRVGESLQAVQAAINRGELRAEANYFAARILHHNNRADLAKALLDRSLSTTDSFPTRGDAEQLRDTL